jgi:5-enolpyruvylshikimate-3-phosphate synthase
MKNKQNGRRAKVAVLALLMVIVLPFVSCKEEEPEPQEHESTINAFDRDITVKGDASISAANFNAANVKLQDAMNDLEKVYPNENTMRPKFDNMLDRIGFVIMIKTGDALPDADANKSMTIGVDYLLGNDAVPTIASAITQKVAKDAFAD